MNRTPSFLTQDEVLALHTDQVTRYGGTSGVRDAGLLQSALAMPEATYQGQFLHPDRFEMAAAYLFHLVKNHPFLDGNKRIGLMTTIAFLGLNGLTLIAEPGELYELVIGVASGQVDKGEAAAFFKANTQRGG